MPLILLFLLFFETVPVRAAKISDTIKSDMKLSVTNSLKKLTGTTSSFKDDRGVVYSLQGIVSTGMWLEYACSSPDLTFNKSEMSVYYNHLVTLIDTFNANYSAKADGLTATAKLDSPKLASNDVAGYAKYANAVTTQSLKTLNAYAKVVLDSYVSKYSSLSGDKKKEFLNKGKVRAFCKAAFRASDRISSEYKDIQAIGQAASAYFPNPYIYSRNISTDLDFVNNSAYKDFIDKGRELINKEIEINELADDFKGDTAIKRYESKIDGEDSAVVNMHYYKCIAASAVYRPLESVVGEKPFLEALKSLDTAKDVVEVYQDNCTIKKPLYKAVTNDDNEFVKADRITIQDFVEDLKKGNSGKLVAIKGKFARNEDGDAFAYYDGKGQAIYEDTLDKATGTVATASSTYKSSHSTKNGNEFIPNQTITDADKLSDSYFDYGYDDRVSATNFLLAANMLINNKVIDSLSNKSCRYLYVNPFGDIVLDNDTVVIPAAANASYYSISKSEKSSNSGGGTASSLVTYNPNTAAFMNYYPTVSLNSREFSASGYKNKFVCFMEYTNKQKDSKNGPTEYQPKDFNQDTVGPALTCDNGKSILYKISSNEESLKTFGNGYNMLPIELTMFDDGSDKVPTMKAMDYSFNFHWNGIFSSFRTWVQGAVCIVPNTKLTTVYNSTTALFPLTGSETDQDFIDRCIYLAGRYYTGMSYDDSGEVVGHNERYNYKKMTKLFECALDGCDNINTYVKNSISEYDANDSDGKIVKYLSSAVKWVVNGLGTGKGAIGVQDSYENPILSKVLLYCGEFMPFIIVAVLVFFLAKYARRRVNIVYATFGTIASLLFVFAFLEILPGYLPVAVNGIVNNTSDDLGYNSMFMRLEQYNNAYADVASVNSDSKTSLDSCSLNLYRIDPNDLDDFCNQLNIDKQDLANGKGYVIDANSGIFVEGDIIKINVDRLMGSLTIKGNYTEDKIQNQYSLSSKKYISSPLDYYCPYYAVVDSFIDKLNKFSKLYQIPTSQVYYPSIKSYKDSFLVNGYVHSDLFLNGDNLEVLKKQFSNELYDNATSSDMFGDNNIDWIGLDYVLTKYITENFDKVKNTLWFQCMVREEYYSKDGQIDDEDGLSKVITNVNKFTKTFLVRNADELQYISDENLVKLTALYATCELDRELGYVTDTIYPESLNYEELSINDVLLPVVTTDYGRYVASNMDLTTYVKEEFGIVGLLLLALVIFLAWLIVNIMKYSIPILYLILLVCIIVRFVIKKEDVKSAVKGYVKIFGALCLCYFAFCFCTAFVKKFNDSVFILVLLFILYSLIITIMATIINALVISKFDFGSVKVTSSIQKLGHKLKLDKIFNKNLLGKFRRNKREEQEPEKWDKYSRYSFNTSLDDVYGEDAYINMMDKKHPDTFSNYNVQRPRKVKMKIDRVNKEYGDFVSEGDSPDDYKRKKKNRNVKVEDVSDKDKYEDYKFFE